MSHRSGCKGPSVGCHATTWGECARNGHIATQWLGGTSVSYGDNKRWNKENDNYAKAVQDGLNPAGVETQHVRAAYEAAEKE